MEHLEAIQRAQLIHCRPDVFAHPQCKRCGYGQVVGGECLQCSAEHDENGNLVAPRIVMEAGDRPPRLQRRRKIR